MNNIMAVKGLNWLGDAILSLPAIQCLKKMFPDKQLLVFTKSYLSDLYSMFDFVDQTIQYDCSLQAYRKLKILQPGTCLILPKSLSSACVCLLARVKNRIGYSAEFRSLFLTNSVKLNPDLLKTHRTHYYYNLLSALGSPPSLSPVIIKLKMKSQEDADNIMVDLKITSNLIGIAPGAAYGNAKQWPVSYYLNLCRQLIDTFNCSIFIFGSKSENYLCEYIKQNAGQNVYNFAGKTSLTLLASLINKCKLYISNDSGTMHLANLLNIPIVVIFGPTDDTTTKPLKQPYEIVKINLNCSPCLERTCPFGHQLCMTQIDVNEVFKACSKYLFNNNV